MEVTVVITPAEIEAKEFSRVVRGYKMEEVDEFLDEIIIDMEKLIKNNKTLADMVDELKEEIERHKKSETSVMNTLESAKKLMKDISESAEKRAEIIIKNARMEADVIVKDAKDSIDRLNRESRSLSERVKALKTRYRQILEDELERVKDGSGDELFADLERELERSPALDEFSPDSRIDHGSSSADNGREKSEEELSYGRQLAELTEGISEREGSSNGAGASYRPKDTIVIDGKVLNKKIGK